MKVKAVLGVSLLSVLATAATLTMARAETAEPEECDTIESCRELPSRVGVRLKSPLHDLTPDLGDIVRNADGTVRDMTQQQAFEYCLNQNPKKERAAIRAALEKNQVPGKGIYLPLAKQLALHAKSLGAQGVEETLQYGYVPIYAKDESGQKVVDFYYNAEGYKVPTDDTRKYWFWTSSVHPDYSVLAYYLDGRKGKIDVDDRSYDFFCAARCVRSR